MSSSNQRPANRGFRFVLRCAIFHYFQSLSLSAPEPTWRQVYRQFGVAPAKASEKRTVQNFRSEVLRELKKIKIAWPELNYTTAPGVLILHPSTPAIPPSSAPARLVE